MDGVKGGSVRLCGVLEKGRGLLAPGDSFGQAKGEQRKEKVGAEDEPIGEEATVDVGVGLGDGDEGVDGKEDVEERHETKDGGPDVGGEATGEEVVEDGVEEGGEEEVERDTVGGEGDEEVRLREHYVSAALANLKLVNLGQATEPHQCMGELMCKDIEHGKAMAVPGIECHHDESANHEAERVRREPRTCGYAERQVGHKRPKEPPHEWEPG